MVSANPPTPIDPAEAADSLAAVLGAQPVGIHTVAGLDRLMAELADEKTVRELAPDLGALAKLPTRAVIVTAAADQADSGYDFVSRLVRPESGRDRRVPSALARILPKASACRPGGCPIAVWLRRVLRADP